MSCDPQTLVDEAKCIECGIPPGMQFAILISLFCQILDNGGTRGGLAGTGSPEGVVTANPGQTYVDTLTGDFYWKGSGTGNTGWKP